MTTTKRSNFSAMIRTTILLASLGGLLVLIGYLIGGPQTALLFLGFAALLNMGALLVQRSPRADDGAGQARDRGGGAEALRDRP